ncbi:protein kinase family protein [Cetobacterium sp. 2A]|uniref:protein kinase domain-containing protein n=1 Tax=Cetobacterium sp. 2A TaxID=2754723 RepID=UPI00163B7A9B|nr:protein kinase family protein [Cetobacterium sp. 2A]MBC2857061.1 protein kinase family protein [Cetobacterium sp. 2A]
MDSILLKNYKILRKIQINSLFEVYEALNLKGNKVIIKTTPDTFFLNKILVNEYTQLKKLKNNFIPQAIEILEKRVLVLEFFSGQNLKEIRVGNKLEWREIRNIFLQLLNLISYLHENGVIHGDIKPENIIYDRNNIFLIDFGSTMEIGQKTAILQYTPSFCDKDNCLVKIKDEKIDYYCLFRVFLYLLRGDREVNFEKLPLKLENFIRKGLEKKLYQPEEILDLWDYLEI